MQSRTSWQTCDRQKCNDVLLPELDWTRHRSMILFRINRNIMHAWSSANYNVSPLDVLLPVITKLVNASLTTAHFPTKWKEAIFWNQEVGYKCNLWNRSLKQNILLNPLLGFMQLCNFFVQALVTRLTKQVTDSAKDFEFENCMYRAIQ